MASRFTGLSSMKIASKLFRINSATVMFSSHLSRLFCGALRSSHLIRTAIDKPLPLAIEHRPKQEEPLPSRVQFPSCHALPVRSFLLSSHSSSCHFSQHTKRNKGRLVRNG